MQLTHATVKLTSDLSAEVAFLLYIILLYYYYLKKVYYRGTIVQTL